MDNDLEQYIDKVFVANVTLHLPTGHIVDPGKSFRMLAAHIEGGCRPDMWITTSAATLAPDQNVRLTASGPKAPAAKDSPAPSPAAPGDTTAATAAPGK